VNIWVEAARPRTLPASLAPVLVGTAAGARSHGIAWVRFALVVVVALAVQVAVNFANDYFDGVRGVDTVQRAGPRRAVASQLVTPRAMVVAIGLAMAVAGGAGLALAALVSWWLLLIGVGAFVALLGYSGGPKPYASQGLGEVFVFIFFGLIATLGSSYVQHRMLPATAWVAAVATGVLAVAILVVNNLRDVPTDAIAGKRTLAVRLGRERTRVMFAVMLGLAFLLALVTWVFGPLGPWVALCWLAAPLAVALVRTVATHTDGPTLNGALARSGMLQLVFCVLLSAGVLLSR
jgi:1,4-dihydroxy-2-naphthoate octaprenyltransferase